MTEGKKARADKTKDEKFEDAILGVIEKAFDAAKTVARVGVKGMFTAKGVADKVESGEAEDTIKEGVAEAEKVMRAGFRSAKRYVKDFLDELVPDEKDPKKKK